MHILQNNNFFLITLAIFAILTTMTVMVQQEIFAGLSMGDIREGAGDLAEKTTGARSMQDLREGLDAKKEEAFNFAFGVPFIIPSTTIGGEVSLNGDLRNILDTDMQLRVAGFNLGDMMDLGSDYTISQEFVSDNIVNIVKDMIPTMKFAKNIDIEEVVSALNENFDTNIPEDIAQAKMKLTLTIKFPYPQININDVASINKIKELWKNPEISAIFEECHSKSTQDILEGECPWRIIQEFKT